MPRTKDLAKIYGAAFYFAHISRDRKKIANHFNVDDRTIARWAKEPEWTHALDAWGYTGDRSFETPPRRDIANKNSDQYQKAKDIYLEALRAGEPSHKLATIAGEAVDLPRATIHRWAMTHNWRDYNNVTFIGVSGRRYQFEPYLILKEFQKIGAIYIFTRREHSKGRFIYTPLYIGRTQSLADRLYDHHKLDCIARYGGNTICIHQEDNEYLCSSKERDLITAYSPVCNR